MKSIMLYYHTSITYFDIETQPSFEFLSVDLCIGMSNYICSRNLCLHFTVNRTSTESYFNNNLAFWSALMKIAINKSILHKYAV